MQYSVDCSIRHAGICGRRTLVMRCKHVEVDIALHFIKFQLFFLVLCFDRTFYLLFKSIKKYMFDCSRRCTYKYVQINSNVRGIVT